MNSYVYILANQKNGTLYIGVTSDLIKRIYEHKQKFVSGFAEEHTLDLLVYFETFENIESAILREKQMKKWSRAWKIELIEKHNPNWDDLYQNILV